MAIPGGQLAALRCARHRLFSSVSGVRSVSGGLSVAGVSGVASVTSVPGVSPVYGSAVRTVSGQWEGIRTVSGPALVRSRFSGVQRRLVTVSGVRMASGDSAQPTEAVRLSGTELSK